MTRLQIIFFQIIPFVVQYNFMNKNNNTCNEFRGIQIEGIGNSLYEGIFSICSYGEKSGDYM